VELPKQFYRMMRLWNRAAPSQGLGMVVIKHLPKPMAESFRPISEAKGIGLSGQGT
jgi:hypothetical protein